MKSEMATLKQQWQQSRALRLAICLSTVLIILGPEVHNVWAKYDIEVRMVPLSQHDQQVTSRKRWSCGLVDG